MVDPQVVQFQVTMPNNQYFSLGIGKYLMANCDMVLFQANGNSSVVTDLYSTGHSVPSIDKQQDY